MKMTLNCTIVSTINIIKTVIILRTVTTSKIRIYPCASITTSVVLVSTPHRGGLEFKNLNSNFAKNFPLMFKSSKKF